MCLSEDRGCLLCVVYRVLCVVYRVLCVVYRVLCVVYKVLCVVYRVQCVGVVLIGGIYQTAKKIFAFKKECDIWSYEFGELNSYHVTIRRIINSIIIIISVLRLKSIVIFID